MGADGGSGVTGDVVGRWFSQSGEYASKAASFWEVLHSPGRGITFIFHSQAAVERISQEPLLLSSLPLPDLRCRNEGGSSFSDHGDGNPSHMTCSL